MVPEGPPTAWCGPLVLLLIERTARTRLGRFHLAPLQAATRCPSETKLMWTVKLIRSRIGLARMPSCAENNR